MTGIVSGAVALGGLIFVFALVDKLLDKGLKPGAIVVFLMFSLAAVFGISGLLIRQLSRVLGAYLGPDEKEKRRLRKKTVVPQLEAPREPIDSVTEHTTRAFEPVLRERE